MADISVEVLSNVVRRHIATYDTTALAGTTAGDSVAKMFRPDTLAFVLVVALVIFTCVVVLSIDYTVGNLMAALAMIESPSSTTLLESAPPARSDKLDALLEKKQEQHQQNYDNDIEIVTIKHQPITSGIKSTIKHLHNIGGFRARWRGLGQYCVYHILINVVGHGLGHTVFRACGPMLSQSIGMTIAILIFCRFRMLWTHAMISAPSTVPWYRRFVARKSSRVLLLPSFVYALAQQVAFASPLATWYVLGLSDFSGPPPAFYVADSSEPALVTLRVLAGLVVFAAAFFFLALPATATLTRIEACLLPENEQIIVPFDHESIMGDIDLTIKGSTGKLFASAWKTVSVSTRARVIKMYVKVTAFQISFILINAVLGFAILTVL